MSGVCAEFTLRAACAARWAQDGIQTAMGAISEPREVSGTSGISGKHAADFGESKSIKELRVEGRHFRKCCFFWSVC